MADVVDIDVRITVTATAFVPTTLPDGTQAVAETEVKLTIDATRQLEMGEA